MTLFSAGCGGGGYLNENDRLRAVNLKLQQQVDQLQRQLELRTDEIDAARQQLEGAPAVEGAEPPRLARIEFDRYTGALDTDDDGTDDTVRLYVQPLDGRGRVLPVSGKLTVRLIAIPETDPPVVLAERTVSPAEWDQAYRSGFLGAHYTIEVGLPQPLPEGVTEATLHATLTQGTTGATFTQQGTIRLAR